MAVESRHICATCGNVRTFGTPAAQITKVTCQRCGGDRHVAVACCHIPGGDPVCILPSGHDGGHDHGHGKWNR